MTDFDKTGPTRTVKAVDLTMAVLAVLSNQKRAGVTEIAEQLNRSKSGVYWHLITLQKHGFVTMENDAYRLGREFVEYGERTKHVYLENFETAKRELDRLAFETGEFVQMLVEDDGEGLFVAKSGGKDAIGSDFRVGQPQPLHVSAAGKSILAHLPEQRRAELVEKCDLDAATPSTLTDPVELSRELDRIRDRGYAWSDEEAAVGIRAVGTVLQDRSRSVLGAISVSGPVSRLHGKYYEEDLPERVMEVANVIEITHNYHS